MFTKYLPAHPGPLLVLSSLAFVHQLELIAFGVLTPEIRDAFGVSDTTIGAIGSVTGLAAFLAALPIGILSDRYSRRAALRIAAVLFVVAGLATSLAWALPALVLARLLAGFPPMTDEVVQPGMLADLYEEREQPAVFAVLRGTVTVSGVSAVVLGAIAASAGWRAAFLFTAALGAAVLVPAWRLHEPGSSEPLSQGLDEGPSGLVRPRWLWITSFFYGACTIPFNQMQSLFFEDVYRTGPFGRGALVSVATAVTLIGLVVGVGIAGRDIRRLSLSGLIAAMTRSMLLLAASITVMAVAPFFWLSAVGLLGTALAIGLLQVAFYPLINRASVPGKRSGAIARVIFMAGLGAIASIPLFTVGESTGYRAATLGAAALGVLMALSSRRLGKDHPAELVERPL